MSKIFDKVTVYLSPIQLRRLGALRKEWGALGASTNSSICSEIIQSYIATRCDADFIAKHPSMAFKQKDTWKDHCMMGKTRKRRKREGRCRDCEDPRCSESMTFCEKHLEIHRQHARESRRRIKGSLHERVY